MHFRDRRCCRAPLIRRWFAAFAAVLIVSGCSTAGETTASSPAAAVTTANAVEPAPSDPAPTPTPPPWATPDVDPTLPPDPTVIPEDVEDIDVEYMQAVVDVFAQNEGEIVREAVRAGELTPRMVELMDRAYGDDLRDLTLLEWQDDFVEDPTLHEFDDDPGNPEWTVEQLFTDIDGCVGLGIQADRNATASGGDLPNEELFLILRQQEQDSDFLPWRLDAILVHESDSDPGNPCSAT